MLVELSNNCFMWDQDVYLKTLLFAGKAHIGQKVPGTDLSYVVHITNVAMEVASALTHTNEQKIDVTLAVQCALLHDTIEDTAVTYEEIKSIFGEQVANGVLALTKNTELPKAEQMQDSLQRIVEQGAAIRIVKMADRINNMQPPPLYWTLEKKQGYHKEAQFILEQLGGVHSYIEERLAQKIINYNHYLK